MIPLAVPNLQGREKKYLAECIDTTFVSSSGPFVTRFEQVITELTEASHAVAMSSGTAAIHAALTAVGVKRDELVILPTLTFIASANAISYCGARPLLMDVDSASWTIDPDQIEFYLENNTEMTPQGVRDVETGQRIAAILPVYILGMPANVRRICEIASRFHLPVVADAAAAIGAEFEEFSLGKMGPSVSAISFNGNKTFTAGGGGAVITNDEALAKRMRHLSTTARVGAEYDHDEIGYNYRLTNVQAAIGCAQLECYDQFLKRKLDIDRQYREFAVAHEGVLAFPQPSWAKSACWFSGLVLENHNNEELISALRGRNIDARPFWKPIHLQKPYGSCPQLSFDVSNSLWRRIVTLPCSTNLTEGEQLYVLEVLNEELTKL